MSMDREEAEGLAQALDVQLHSYSPIYLTSTTAREIIAALRAAPARCDAPSDALRQALKLMDERLKDLRETNEIFRKSSWYRGSEIQRNEREIRWIIDFRSILVGQGVSQPSAQSKDAAQ